MAYDLEKEKREAVEAAKRALRSLREAEEQLNSAKNWGLWDMFGGGFISTMVKQSKMDRAKQSIPKWIGQNKVWNRRNMISEISAEN